MITKMMKSNKRSFEVIDEHGYGYKYSYVSA